MKAKNVLLALSIFTMFFGCQFEQPTTLPKDVMGEWKTSASEYNGRSFELTNDFIVFVSGDYLENIDVNFVRKIEQTQQGKATLYTIYYEDIEDREYRFAFYYDPSEGGVIRLKNKSQFAWRKTRDPITWKNGYNRSYIISYSIL